MLPEMNKEIKDNQNMINTEALDNEKKKNLKNTNVKRCQSTKNKG
jgi:hypothetical protein